MRTGVPSDSIDTPVVTFQLDAFCCPVSEIWKFVSTFRNPPESKTDTDCCLYAEEEEEKGEEGEGEGHGSVGLRFTLHSFVLSRPLGAKQLFQG